MYQYSNPYMQYGMSQQQIIRVNGMGGAQAYQMMPNSSALLLDENNPLLYLAQTDGAGYKTVTTFKIEAYTPVTQSSLEERIKRLEEAIYDGRKSNNSDAQRTATESLEPGSGNA